jgi:hypothetical protein
MWLIASAFAVLANAWIVYYSDFSVLVVAGTIGIGSIIVAIVLLLPGDDDSTKEAKR